MEIPKRGNPIQRHPLLKNISKANHDILVFCLNINLGLRNQVEITQINQYINHIVEEFLFANFQFKKLFLNPLVENEEKAVKQSNDFWERFNDLKNNPKNL
jgi:hypothetical protein